MLIGLSGGIDSSLVAAIAADALGPERVTGVLMPSRYSSDGSITDAEELAREPRDRDRSRSRSRRRTRRSPTCSSRRSTGPSRGWPRRTSRRGSGARSSWRISNKFGWMVLTTGNKSEMATGYSTLYGDMAGGFAVIKDVPKMLVYALSRRPQPAGRAARSSPSRCSRSRRAPSCGPTRRTRTRSRRTRCSTRCSRTTSRRTCSAAEIEAEGFDRETVDRVVALVDRSEYKRRQAPPGVRVSAKAFGKDRRLPITNRWPG